MTETPEVRPRKSGKSHIQKLAKGTGLKPETVRDLLAAGWTLIRKDGKPARWEQGAQRRDVSALAVGGLLPRGSMVMVGDGCVLPGGPGFGPGPSFGAGAIQIQVTEDPNVVAHQVANELQASILRLRGHQRNLS